jgi:hypothetical protein
MKNPKSKATKLTVVNGGKKTAHKPDPKRVAAAKLAWSRGPKLLKIKAAAQAKLKNAKLSKKVAKQLPATIKAVAKKIAAAAPVAKKAA